MGISLRTFRDVIDDLEIRHSVDKSNGSINFTMTMDNEESVRFVFFINEEQEVIQAIALLCDRDIIDSNDFHEAYKFCNHWNDSYKYPKSYVHENTKSIMCEWTWDTEVDYSDELIKRIILVGFIKTSQSCFEEAIKNNIYTN